LKIPFGNLFSNLLIPLLVINWQSYNSTLVNPWHWYNCSNDKSVISGQLSNSNTCNDSFAQFDELISFIPSSVINSHRDSVKWRNDGQFKDKFCNVESVI
jgi:hypothetical protein